MDYTIYPNSDGDHQVRRDIARMIRRHELTRDRSLQVALGPSQIGIGCDRSLAYMVSVANGDEDRTGNTRNDPLPAIIGTAMHAWMEEAAAKDNMISSGVNGGSDRWKTEVEVSMRTPAGRIIPGSVDLWDEHTFTVIDHKVLGVSTLRRMKADGPGEQYHTQIQLYGYGMEMTHGYVPNAVALCLIPRNGTIGTIQYIEFPYDRDYAQRALARYDSIVSAQETRGWERIEAIPEDTRCRYCPVATDSCSEGLIYR